MRFSILLFAAVAIAMAGCDSSDPIIDPQPVNLEVEMMENVVADPATVPPDGGQPVASGRFTLIDLATGEIVLSYDELDRSDSTSTNWDIGFSGTNVIANATAGSEGGIQYVDGLFDELTEAPTSGYADMLVPGSDNSWYNYAGPPSHLITPIPGRVIVLRTADGNYAKIRVVSYYKDAPENPDAFADEDRHYTFEYVYQPDGSTGFETTTGSN